MTNKKLTFDIVWYLSGDWETDHRRQMITSFAKNMLPYGKILCVNRPICLLTSLFLKRNKFINWVRGQLALNKITDNLYVYTPFVLIHDQIAIRLHVLAFLNKRLLTVLLKRVIDRIGFKGKFRLSWVYTPSQYDYIGLVNEVEYIYECFDNYAEFKFALMKRQQVEFYDRILTKNALIVFNTAKKLYEEKVKINPKSYYVPNAVNLKLFSMSSTQNDNIPDDLKKLPTPIVSFIGNVNPDITDCQLVQKLALANPSTSFVFLGKMQKTKEVDELLKLRNVHHLGLKKYEDLPSYVFSFDIGIIPFKINEITKCLNPLKLYEYMAAGCPVVATDIPEVHKFSDLINIAKNKDDFDYILKKLLSSDLSELKVRLLNEAKKHSWERRTSEMISHIKNCLNERL